MMTGTCKITDLTEGIYRQKHTKTHCRHILTHCTLIISLTLGHSGRLYSYPASLTWYFPSSFMPWGI